jgi:tetratricopeptide (TPR) repeat protein
LTYKGKEITPKEVGEELIVDALFISRIRQQGNMLSISVELVNTSDGSLIKGTEYSHELEDIEVIERELANLIAQELKLKTTEEEKLRLTKQYTEDTEAYNLYMMGHDQRKRLTKDGFKKSFEYFNAAIKKDPNYALAYSGLATLYGNSAYWGYLPPNDAYPKLRRAAEKALELDETLAEAHGVLAAFYIYYDWNWVAAERESKRALELDPKLADINYAYFLLFTGQVEEAILEIKRAQKLDPRSDVIRGWVAWILFNAQKYDEAIEKAKEGIENNPHFYQFYTVLGLAYSRKSMMEEAIVELEKAQGLYSGDLTSLLSLGVVYYQSGRINEAEEIFDFFRERAKQDYIPPTTFALIHSTRGEMEESLLWLEKAYDEHDIWLPMYSVPAMRHQLPPRFEDILKRMGLE